MWKKFGYVVGIIGIFGFIFLLNFSSLIPKIPLITEPLTALNLLPKSEEKSVGSSANEVTNKPSSFSPYPEQQAFVDASAKGPLTNSDCDEAGGFTISEEYLEKGEAIQQGVFIGYDKMVEGEVLVASYGEIKGSGLVALKYCAWDIQLSK